MPAPDYLRILYRKGRLTPKEHDARLQSLKHLSAGHLRPALPVDSPPLQFAEQYPAFKGHKGRPRRLVTRPLRTAETAE